MYHRLVFKYHFYVTSGMKYLNSAKFITTETNVNYVTDVIEIKLSMVWYFKLSCDILSPKWKLEILFDLNTFVL